MDELATPPIAASRWLATSAQEEALARIEYLVRKQRSVGLLVGSPGSGKSTLLQRAAQQWRRQGAAIALIDATALASSEALAALNTAWGHAVEITTAPARQWQAITEALTVQRCEQRASVVFVDDAGSASFELLDLLTRLVHLADGLDAPLSMILAADPQRVSHLGRGLLSRIDLRMELSPLDLDETRQYLELIWSRQQVVPPLPDDGAVTRLHELTAGLPRRLDQLTELVLLAAAADGRDGIDAETIDKVYRELTVPLHLQR